MTKAEDVLDVLQRYFPDEPLLYGKNPSARLE